MIDHAWTVICSHAVIDRDTNNVSLLDVVEQLDIGDKPSPEGGILFYLDVMTLWSRADYNMPAQGRGRVSFLSPTGKVNDGPFKFDIDLSRHNRHRTRGRFRALRVTESGRYTFLVELQVEGQTEWHEVAAIPLEINFLPPDEAEKAADESEK